MRFSFQSFTRSQGCGIAILGLLLQATPEIAKNEKNAFNMASAPYAIHQDCSPDVLAQETTGNPFESPTVLPENDIEVLEDDSNLLAPLPETSESDPDASTTPVSPPQIPAAPPDGAPTVFVQSILIEGSTVFSPEQLDQTVFPFTGKVLTFEDLQGAANAVTQLYLEAGYINTRAVLPPQDIVDGMVKLQVIEGRLEAIQVEGTNRLATYVKQRVALAAGSPVSQRAIENQLRLLRLDPLFEDVTASLRQGQGPDSSILVVRVSDAPALSGSIGLDTLSPPSVGKYRTGATLQYLNPLGLGDRLAAAAYRTTTGGSVAYDLSYQVPLNPMNGTLLLRTTPSNYRITDPTEPTFDLGLRGETDVYEMQYRQPLIRTIQEEFALSAGFRYRNGSTLLSGLITPPLITSVFYFGQDYLKRDTRGVWGARSQFRLGSQLFDATTREEPLPDGQFFSWQGQVQRLQVLGRNHQLLIQGQVQLTPDSLLGSEQFFIGGAQSVRGYFQNQRFGDNGIRLSIEDRITFHRNLEGKPFATAIPFLDFGHVWYSNQDLQPTTQNFLLGTGVGLEFTPNENLTGRVELGIPLLTADELTSDRPVGAQFYLDFRYRF